MARKTAHYTSPHGRDKGKVFLLEEKPAYQTEWFAYQLFTLILQHNPHYANVDIDKVKALGAAGLIQIGITAIAQIPALEVKPLLDEMLTCVKVQEKHVARDWTNDDIEEVLTFKDLREAIIELHLGFSNADGQLSSKAGVSEAQKPAPSMNIKMPQPPLRR